MLVIVPDAGHPLKAESVAAFASSALPRFAEPRYIEIATELARFPTKRVQKAQLRKRGVTDTTWDHQRAST
jgi:crotonobetaine/carnitine-CoA ligase